MYTYKEVESETHDYEISITNSISDVQINATEEEVKEKQDLLLKLTQEKHDLQKLLEESKHELDGTYTELQQMQVDWEREIKLRTDSQWEPENTLHGEEKDHAEGTEKIGNSHEATISDKVEEYKKIIFQVSQEFNKLKSQLSRYKQHNIDLKKWFEDIIESVKYNNQNQAKDLENSYRTLLETNNILPQDNSDIPTKPTLEPNTSYGNTENKTYEKIRRTLTKCIDELDAIESPRNKEIWVSGNTGTNCSSNNVHKRFEIGGKELAED